MVSYPVEARMSKVVGISHHFGANSPAQIL